MSRCDPISWREWVAICVCILLLPVVLAGLLAHMLFGTLRVGWYLWIFLTCEDWWHAR